MFRFASDLHLEFYQERILNNEPLLLETLTAQIFKPLPTDKDTVLVLAGDIILIKYLKHFNPFFEILSNQFKTVLWVFGNHEWFKSTLSKETTAKIKLELSYLSNIHILDNEIFEDENYYFIGSTLWSDIKKGDYLTATDVAKVSYDYKKIKYKEGSHYSKLRPRHITKTFIDNEKFILDSLKKIKESEKKKVVVTHHPPMIEALPEYIKINPDFWSDFGNVNFKKIKEEGVLPDYWIHGHIHENQSFDIMGINIISNTRGYDDQTKSGQSMLNKNFSNELLIN